MDCVNIKRKHNYQLLSSFLLHVATQFNQPMNKWNVSNVTNMNGMFKSSRDFNQPLNKWVTTCNKKLDKS